MRDSAIEDLAGQIASDEADLKAATVTELDKSAAETGDAVKQLQVSVEGLRSKLGDENERRAAEGAALQVSMAALEDRLRKF